MIAEWDGCTALSSLNLLLTLGTFRFWAMARVRRYRAEWLRPPSFAILPRGETYA
jgi:hypothetical protein